MQNIFFNAHHSPIGAFATFTLGNKGATGGLGLELGKPADQSVYIGLESNDGSRFEALPFFAGAAGADAAQRYEVEHGAMPSGQGIEEVASKRPHRPLTSFPDDLIAREFRLCRDTWKAGDMAVTIYSPVRPVPDPETADEATSKSALVPAVQVEITIDNRAGTRSRQAFFGFTGSDPYAGLRRLDDVSEGRFSGVGQGRLTAIASRDAGVLSGQGFTIDSILNAHPAENLTFGLGNCAALLFDTPAGEIRTFRFAVCFYREGNVTAGLDAAYAYTQYFRNIEEVADYTLTHFDDLIAATEDAERRISDAPSLSDDQRFMLAHAIRSYYGSTQYLIADSKPLWVVNEGEYRMMNTFDLTVDHLYFELAMNPWVVRNVLDLFVDRYSYSDSVFFPVGSPEGAENLHPGGISFTHDMGVSNVFSRPGYSSYEAYGKRGCFSYMTHEQLVNWICCAVIYICRTGDTAWRDRQLPVLYRCLESLLHRDHPDPAQRDGVMSLDSSRTMGGSEITTYDSLDESLGQARDNVYLAVKTWAAYLLLERVFLVTDRPKEASIAAEQATRCADTIVSYAGPDGLIPAILGGDHPSFIIPAIEGLIFPYAAGFPETQESGRFPVLIQALRTHLNAVLKPGLCLFPDGGWKLSSTANNSWLSKIYLCQFVAREILGVDGPTVTEIADRAHVGWLTDPRNTYWAWSDQMVTGHAIGSKYYPRGVTAFLWLEEDDKD